MSVPESGTAAADSPVQVVAPPVQSRRAYASGLIGSTIEFYDFFVYATAATLVFGPVFFHGMSTAVGIIASFGTLAVGYIARPLGGILFGHWGDRFSRKNALITTIVAMGTVTALIGVLPTSAQAGALAPILLVVLRVAQGIAVGGEWSGSVLLTVETAPSNKRGLFGSATTLGGALGFLLSIAAFAALGGLSQEAFLSWGWRLPFLASLVLLALGLYMRLRLQESSVQQAAKAQGDTARIPLAEVFSTHLKRTLLGVGVFTGPFAMSAIISTFAVTFATTYAGVSRQAMINLLIGVAVMNLLFIPLFASLSDRFGRKAVYLPAVAGMLVTAFLLFPAISSGKLVLIVLVYAVHGGILHSAAAGTVGALLSEQFPTRVRYTGTAVAFQGSALVGGALGPLLSAIIGADGGGIVALGVVMAAAILISVLCVLALSETHKDDLVSV
ncbi:MFS transporter [Spirillospora sp. CA-255316]